MTNPQNSAPLLTITGDALSFLESEEVRIAVVLGDQEFNDSTLTGYEMPERIAAYGALFSIASLDKFFRMDPDLIIVPWSAFSGEIEEWAEVASSLRYALETGHGVTVVYPSADDLELERAALVMEFLLKSTARVA